MECTKPLRSFLRCDGFLRGVEWKLYTTAMETAMWVGIMKWVSLTIGFVVTQWFGKVCWLFRWWKDIFFSKFWILIRIQVYANFCRLNKCLVLFSLRYLQFFKKNQFQNNLYRPSEPETFCMIKIKPCGKNDKIDL